MFDPFDNEVVELGALTDNSSKRKFVDETENESQGSTREKKGTNIPIDLTEDDDESFDNAAVESEPSLVRQVELHYEKMKVTALKTMLAKRNLATGGLKAVLVKRLESDDNK